MSNKKSIATQKPELVIQSDVSSWGPYCLKVSTKRSWSCENKSLDINILELRSGKFSILTFGKGISNLVAHIQKDNQTALAYLMKLGWRAKYVYLIQETKEHVGILHVSSERILLKIVRQLGQVCTYLFACRLYQPISR